MMNSASAPITHATSGMSGMPWRATRQKNGHDPTTSRASHASRRLTSRASIHHISASPHTAHRMNGRRIAIIVRPSCTISPEYPPSAASPSARIPPAMSQNERTGLLRNPSPSCGHSVCTQSWFCSIIRATSP